MSLPSQILDIATKYFRVAHSSGDNIQCYCPFHKGGKERTPSFYIYMGPPTGNRTPGMAFCHTCDKGWSLRTLLLELGLRRPQVDSILDTLPAIKRREGWKRQLVFNNPVLPEALLGVFEWCPRSLLEKGFEKALLRKFEVGYDKGLRRITFPLRDHLGELVGISGRTTLPGTNPRYLVYGEEELGRVVPGYKAPSKGRFLWNLHSFYTTALHRRIPHVIVVEGFKQALWVAQAEFEYVVALMGSKVTDEQAALLLRLGVPILLFLDNDEPGKAAMEKARKKLRRQSPDVYLVKYPGGAESKSPDDLTSREIRQMLEAVPCAMT